MPIKLREEMDDTGTPSTITFNGQDKRNTRYKDFSEIKFIKNEMEDGKWLIEISDL